MPDIKTQTKIAVLIEKINYLFSTIQQNNGALNKIDKDLMMNYVKELYELTLSLQVETPQAPPSYQQPQNYSNQPMYPQQDTNTPNGYSQQPQQQQTHQQQPHQQQSFQQQAPQQQPFNQPQSAEPQQPVSTPANQNGSNNGSSNTNGNTNNNGSNNNGNGNYTLKPNNEPVQGNSINQAYSSQGQKKTLADMYSIKTGSEKLSVNEKLNQPKPELADKLKKTPIKDLKVFIGLNKRFSYINFLFNNNTLLYDEAVDKINNSRNYDEAMKYIEADLLPKLKWHADDETVEEFYNIIERRFLA